MNTKGILAALGLAALVAGSGCEDKNERFVQAQCNVNGKPLVIEYFRLNAARDKVRFYYEGNTGSIESYADSTSASFKCDDGRILNFENGDVFWGTKIKSESQ